MITKSVDIEVDIELADVIDFIQCADDAEKLEISGALNEDFYESDLYNLLRALHREKTYFGDASVLEMLKRVGFEFGFVF